MFDDNNNDDDDLKEEKNHIRAHIRAILCYNID